jgi:release factor glutamine methyltransferase
MTIQDARREGIRLLRRGGVPGAALDADLFLAEALHTGKVELILRGGLPIGEGEYRRFRGFIRRRLSGEAAAYILGRKEFWGLEFSVTPAVLIPRPDTEILVERALYLLGVLSPPLRVLDLCTGSGAVGIALKRERPDLEVWASDISPAALEIAERNAAKLLPGGRGGIRFLPGDLFSALDTPEGSGFFSLILGNPPYIPSGLIDTLPPEVRREPRISLDGGEDGLALIRRIARGAPGRLREGGVLLLEGDPGQMPAMGGILTGEGFSRITFHRDLSGDERVIEGWKDAEHTGLPGEF